MDRIKLMLMVAMIKKVGRRPGRSTTKTKILAVSETMFAENGYDQTTIRAIAERAKVDPALVIHYFNSKQELFISAMAPPQQVPLKIARELSRGNPDTLGLRLATLFVSMLESKTTSHIVINTLKAAIHIPGATALLKKLLVRPILQAFKDAALDQAELRATLAQSQLVGIVMSRYILKVEPLASLPPDELIAYLAPTLQRYLTGNLTANKKEVL